MTSISNFILSLPTSIFSQTQQPSQQNTDETINTNENNNTDNIPPSMNDLNSPITGICLVSKPNNVPTGYQCIRKGKNYF